MKWLWQKREPMGEDKMELEEARLMREHAERTLREARAAAREVRNVVIESRRIRSENQFSQRLTEAFGSRPQNNG
jgi:hypothetical protein